MLCVGLEDNEGGRFQARYLATTFFGCLQGTQAIPYPSVLPLVDHWGINYSIVSDGGAGSIGVVPLTMRCWEPPTPGFPS